LALLAALLLIGAAFGVRAIVGDDGGGEDGKDKGGEVESDDALVLGCVTELIDLCRALDGVDNEVEVNPGGVATAIKDSKIDAWVTFDPWPVAEDFAGDGLFEAETIPVAEDTLGVVISKPYVDQLTAASCDADALTRCAAEATTTDADARFGVGDPKSALGGILLTAMVTEVLDTFEFDIDAVQEQAGLITKVLESIQPTNQLTYRLGLGAEAKVAVLSREGVADDFVPTQQGIQKELEFVPVRPPIRVRVVMAVVPGADRGDLDNLLDNETTTPKLFEDVGWDVESDQPTGLPAGDVLLALVEEYGR
jgi:hypothetical protein